MDKSLWQGKAAGAVAAFMTTQMRSNEGLVSAQASETAMSRMDRLSFALAAYLKTHRKFPDHLTELTPKYLPEIPHDPFTDQPFQYSSQPTGCMISSPRKFPPQLAFEAQLQYGRPIVVHLSLPPEKPTR
ncbi:MAG: hypothetical protein ACP5I8_13140 [Phycisphaerae bacterium]